MRQVDQIFCDQCGQLQDGNDGSEHMWRKDREYAKKHARENGHDVHILFSDSLHYYGDAS